MWPQGRGQPAAAGNASFSQAPLLGGISRASLHLRQLIAALSNFIHHGPFYVPLFSLWTPTLGQDWEMEKLGSQKNKAAELHSSWSLLYSSLLPLDTNIRTGLGDGEIGKSVKQSSRYHLVAISSYGGISCVHLGGTEASKVMVRMGEEPGRGLEAA